jgi:O-succinylbenzoic acid--CoA ligase
MLMSGYRLRPDLSADAVVDGELRTEDHGRWVAGRLVVDGRLDDVIVTGGENVVAGRVAAALAEHPDVADAAVTGVPDARWGQRVVAVVVARGTAPALDELRRWVAARESVAAAPKAVVFVETIPRLASGKPDRRAVEQLAQAAPA